MKHIPLSIPLKERAWRIATTPKIKIFIWKVLNGSSGVLERLQAKRSEIGYVIKYVEGQMNLLTILFFDVLLDDRFK